MRGQTFRFDKDLMRVLVGKTHDLVFDRRAVTRADPFDHPGIHRTAIQIGADHIMCLHIGMGDETGYLARMLFRFTQIGEYRHRIVTQLHLQL